MDLLQHFQDVMRKNVPANTPVLVAVSGGMDSVVLADLCARAGIKFMIAHCNFQLRGEESNRDEAFVRALADKLKVPVFVAGFDTKPFATEHKLSVQEAARQLRYRFFDETLRLQQCSFTLLAHHADDNIETMLMNFFRGTGLDGLTGMPSRNPDQANCFRPLLSVRRKDIEQYARNKGLQWVEDSSNLTVQYTRNFFRHELIPVLQQVFPQAEENLLDNIRRLSQTKLLYTQLVDDLKQKICRKKGNETHIPVLKLLNYRDTSLVFEIIRDYGFSESQAEEVMKLASAPSGKYIANEHFQIIKHRNWLIIAPVAQPSETIVVDRHTDLILFADSQLSWKEMEVDKWKLNKTATVAQLDASLVEWPLVVRKWRPGDYFYPFGLRKKKKLARFFIDNKLSKIEKENTWVIESHKRIIWIVGHRIDDRFKVTATTKKVLQITLSSP